MDVLVLSATNQFHNNVNRSLTSQKSMPSKVSIINRCASMTCLKCLIVGTTAYPRDHISIVGTTTVLINHHPIISTTSNPTKQVTRMTKNTEGLTPFSFPEFLPTVAELYRITPQDGDKSYKAEALGANVLFDMLRKDSFGE